MDINFLKFSKIYYAIFGVLALLSVILIIAWGLNLGIDLKGGAVMEVSFNQGERPLNNVLQEKLLSLDLGEIIIQPKGQSDIILRTKDITPYQHQQILQAINEISLSQETQFESIGPVLGKEIKDKTNLLIVVSLACLLLYIAIAFRKVSWPIASWQYGLISTICLAADVLLTIGILVVLGRTQNVQFNIPIITAILTILGYTINDKVIVFDRVRENLLRHRKADFKALVNDSLNQTLGRSLSTGFCALIVLIFLFFLGGETLKFFALTLILGIVVGTFSSLFLASSLLVSFYQLRKL